MGVSLLRRLLALFSMALLISGCQHQAPAYVSPYDSSSSGESVPDGPPLGPLAAALQAEIVQALQATNWPSLDPSIESVLNGPKRDPEVSGCGGSEFPTADKCTWGADGAPVRAVLVGDSVALGYAGPLREIALASGGRMQVHVEAMLGCTFVNDLIDRSSLSEACPGRKQHAIDVINATKPDVVIISNEYQRHKVVGADKFLTPAELSESKRAIVNKFIANTRKVVFLAAPPGDAKIGECYGKRSSTPAECIGEVSEEWAVTASAEQDLAESFGGAWVDSRPWFCASDGFLCPSFAGNTVTKIDEVHMSPAYGRKISAVIGESLTEAGVL